ncbi:MAG: response regulator transcription factor [Elusimicrobia bacterium]|nr:response regulator transcription factor [Elusimicrobiota bacterium]
MTTSRVLIIDDETDFRRLIEQILEKEGFLVLNAGDAQSGIKTATQSHPDLILLDWNLPDKDGVQVCRALKSDAATKDIPILMLTVRGRETDVVVGLEVGAADFISKRALRPRELVARVRAALRRGVESKTAGETLRSGALSLDTGQHRVFVGKEEVELRAKEFDLLYVFLKNKGRLLSRNFLEESVWGTEYYATSRAIDTTIARLRAKINKEGAKIQGIKGLGYRFDEEAP